MIGDYSSLYTLIASGFMLFMLAAIIGEEKVMEKNLERGFIGFNLVYFFSNIYLPYSIGIIDYFLGFISIAVLLIFNNNLEKSK